MGLYGSYRRLQKLNPDVTKAWEMNDVLFFLFPEESPLAHQLKLVERTPCDDHHLFVQQQGWVQEHSQTETSYFRASTIPSRFKVEPLPRAKFSSSKYLQLVGVSFNLFTLIQPLTSSGSWPSLSTAS